VSNSRLSGKKETATEEVVVFDVCCLEFAQQILEPAVDFADPATLA
jgi:hypothetical protein